MYTALQQEKADDICHLWRIACSVHIHVTLVEKGNDVVSQQYLLQRSLECSCEKDLLAEDSFVTWSNKLLRYLGLVTKTSKNRSLKADLEERAGWGILSPSEQPHLHTLNLFIYINLNPKGNCG